MARSTSWGFTVRRMLILLASAGLALAGVSAPAHAVRPEAGSAAAQQVGTPPSAPRALATSSLDERGVPGGVLQVSWTRPAATGSARVKEYQVRIKPAPGAHQPTPLVVPASRTRATFRHLESGTAYRVSVRAVSKAGRSPAATVRYVVPQRPRAWVFALDTDHASIVRVPVNGGTVQTVARSRTAWAVNAAGDVYVIDAASGTVTRTPADGSLPQQIGSGFTDLTDVQLDEAGRVYVVDGSRVVRMSSTGQDREVVAQPVSLSVFVRADGAVSTTAGDGMDTPLQLVTYPSGGGRPAARTLAGQGGWGEYYPGRGRLIGDRAGNLFLAWISGGGSGFEWWFRVPAGAASLSATYTREAYYAVTVDPRDRFYLAQTATFCDSISESEGTCTPDLTVDEILRYDRDGKRQRLPIAPFSYQRANGNSASTLVVDRRGRLFVAQPVGPSAGLLAYGPRGGAPRVLAHGAFTEARRNN